MRDPFLANLSVALVDNSDLFRFNSELDEHHWLGHRMVGETLRYVVRDLQGNWVALLGFASPALYCKPRDDFIGWSREIQAKRLKFIASNQRFCILPAGRVQNTASVVMSKTLKRLSSDWMNSWGHPVLMVETFVDPSRHLGTCYAASSFIKVGETLGYGRRSGRYVSHGNIKDLYVKTLHRYSVTVLSALFDHPLLLSNKRSSMAQINFNTADLSSLLSALGEITDIRKKRGIRHDLTSTLALCAAATIAGNKSLSAISEFIDQVPQEALARLGTRISPHTGKRIPPAYPTIRRALMAVDPQELDEVVNSWAIAQLEQKTDKQKPDKNMTDTDNDTKGGSLSGIAVDGKALRGAKQMDGTRVHLLSALDHDSKATLGQHSVPTDKTNEITVFEPLLSKLTIIGKVVTADAMHTQVKAARSVVQEKQAHYIFGVKGNQPTLHNAAQDALGSIDINNPLHESEQRGHGRIDRHRVWVKEIPKEIKFPHAQQFIFVERKSSDLLGNVQSIETKIYVTDLKENEADAQNLFRLVSGHWAIESHHWIRDVVFNEDLSQIRKGTLPRAMATLRNLAITAIRLAAGVTANIAKATRQLGRNPDQTLDLLGIPPMAIGL